MALSLFPSLSLANSHSRFLSLSIVFCAWLYVYVLNRALYSLLKPTHTHTWSWLLTTIWVFIICLSLYVYFILSFFFLFSLTLQVCWFCITQFSCVALLLLHVYMYVVYMNAWSLLFLSDTFVVVRATWNPVFIMPAERERVARCFSAATAAVPHCQSHRNLFFLLF